AALGYGAYDNVMHKYTGKERDAESGLDFFGARYFSGAQGRFTSPDEPFADQHPEDPQSWNLYGYVRNNPLKNTDPNGKDCQNGVAACANYFAGAFGAVVNAFSSGLINAPNHIANAVISLTGSDFRFPDAVQPAFTPANEEQQQGQQAANAVMLVAPVAEAGATALVEAVGTGTRVEAAAAAATDVPTSIPAGPTARPTAAQQAAINEMGDAHGCNTCGTSNPGTQSGNWVGDHQPPTALNPPGGAQVYQPQCLQCSRQQGGQVAAAVKAAKKAACTTGSNGTTTCQ
ncbi:MAG: RHS repeat-associated core domain-containing protein, partial [Bryobacteraceae bacterium]